MNDRMANFFEDGSSWFAQMAGWTYFLCRWLKEQVYSTKSSNLGELERQIREVMITIPQEFLIKPADATPG